jgi:hypothetical protein
MEHSKLTKCFVVVVLLAVWETDFEIGLVNNLTERGKKIRRKTDILLQKQQNT